MDEDALDHFATAVSAAHDPQARALDAFATAVSAVFGVAGAVDEVFTDAAERPGGNPELHLRLMDGVAQARALRRRTESRYSPAEELLARAQAHGGAPQARIWC
jgi:hypothetical protein